MLPSILRGLFLFLFGDLCQCDLEVKLKLSLMCVPWLLVLNPRVLCLFLFGLTKLWLASNSEVHLLKGELEVNKTNFEKMEIRKSVVLSILAAETK